MIKTQGIVLSELRYKDSSKILNIYTKDYGKLPVMAQGALRAKSKLIASSQIFSCSDFILTRGRNFYYIKQADMVESFYSIRENIERISYGFYMVELLEKSLLNEEKNEKMFFLLRKGLKSLSLLNRDYLKLILAYELKFISFLGYRPYIKTCVSCNKELQDRIKFSNYLGGVLCNNCGLDDLESVNIDLNSLKILNKLLLSTFEELDNLNYRQDSLNRLHRIIVEYILFNIERKEFKSLNILEATI